MNSIDSLRRIVAGLKPGQRVRVTRAVLEEFSVPTIWASLIPSVPERVLSDIMGSAYEFGFDWREGDVEFYRLESPLEDGRRSFVERDRQHLYGRRADGLWYPNYLAIVKNEPLATPKNIG